MRRNAALFVALLVFMAVWATPLFAARAIQGSVGEITVADAAALGPIGFQIWSAQPGGTTVINNNTASCRMVRCIKSFVTIASLASPGAPGGGGYVANQEATQVYNSDLQDQPFYMLADASMNNATPSHIGFFGVSGVTANNAGLGQHLAQQCGTTGAQNCFGRIDMASAAPPLYSTWIGYGGWNTIRAIGGLNPIPNVLVATTTSADNTAVMLAWVDPPTYPGAMRPSTSSPAPPSPVIGVALYKNDRPSGACDAPTANDPAWAKMADYPLGGGSRGIIDDAPANPTFGCRWYALKVRLIGPGGPPNQIETVLGVNSQPARGDATAVRITRFTTTYAGHGNVIVGWTSGVEGGVRGYYLTRALTASGPFTRISGLIPGKGDESSYTFTDSPGGLAARAYFYRLEIVGSDGTVSTSSIESVNLPSRTRKSGPAIR